MYVLHCFFMTLISWQHSIAFKPDVCPFPEQIYLSLFNQTDESVHKHRYDSFARGAEWICPNRYRVTDFLNLI